MTSISPTVVPILTYHSVSEDPRPGEAEFTVSPQQFADHLAVLVGEGYTPLRISELAHAIRAGHGLPSRPVCITFDDGFADFATHALPRMAAHDIPSTLYMITGRVRTAGQVHPGPAYLSWEELRDVERAGVEIGSHSHSHQQLDTLPLAEARAELVVSKRLLQDKLGHEVTGVAYPYGYHGPAVRRLAIETGYHSACAVKQALSAAHDDVFALSRLLVRTTTDVAALRSWLEGRGLRVAPRGERPATIGWRWARRARATVLRVTSRERASHAY